MSACTIPPSLFCFSSPEGKPYLKESRGGVLTYSTGPPSTDVYKHRLGLHPAERPTT
jgi:hypothetical protein